MNTHPTTKVNRMNSQTGIIAIINHPSEFPSNGHFVAKKSITSLIIKPTAFSTSDDVRSLDPDDRQCYYDVIYFLNPSPSDNLRIKFFQHEVKNLKLSHLKGLPYTRASCFSACRREHLMKYCNCTVGILFPSDNYLECNVTGLICLIKYNEIFNAEKVPKSEYFDQNEDGIECSCLPECSRIEYGVTLSPIYDEQAISEEFVKIDVHYTKPTMMKYRTDVTFGWMDLVVGFGGILGLFFGCSLLSCAEISYFSTIGLYYQYKRNRGEVMKKIKAKFPFLN